MTTDTKKRFTLRMDQEVSDELALRAKRLGLNKNAYITMILHKEFQR